MANQGADRRRDARNAGQGWWPASFLASADGLRPPAERRRRHGGNLAALRSRFRTDDVSVSNSASALPCSGTLRALFRRGNRVGRMGPLYSSMGKPATQSSNSASVISRPFSPGWDRTCGMSVSQPVCWPCHLQRHGGCVYGHDHHHRADRCDYRKHSGGQVAPVMSVPRI